MITSSNSKCRSAIPARSKKAFTLVEVLIAISLFAMIMAAIVPTFMTFARHSTSLGNYAEMGMDSRFALELIARDLHAADDITHAADDRVTVVLPTDLGGETINYVYDATAQTFTRSVTDASGTTDRVLFDNVEKFAFVIYNRLGASHGSDSSEWPSILTEAKSVQMDAVMQRKVLATKNTDYVISAKFMMRNL